MHQRRYSVDYLRMVLAAFVVVGHSGLGRESVGVVGLILGSTVLRSAVPLFALVAGFFLYRTLRDGRFALWFWRLIALYLLWSLFYYLFTQGWHDGWRRNLYDLLFGYRHLWFLQALPIAGAILFLFRRRSLRAVVVSTVLFALAGLVMEYLSYLNLAPIPLEVFRSGPFLLYPFLAMGYLMRVAHEEPHRMILPVPRTGQLVALTLAGAVLSIVENLVFLAKYGPWGMPEYTIGLYLMGPAVFAALLRLRAPATALPLAQMSLGIYVLHMAILHVAGRMGHDHPLLPALAGFLIPAVLFAALVPVARRSRVLRLLF